MNKSKIEWCDDTWNPVTGCLHDCPYCYARRIANRFGKGSAPTGNQNIHELYEKHYDKPEEHMSYEHDPYPWLFEPTFHRYRLDEPERKTRPRKIFVCSMADLFGDWVPDEWLQEVFDACGRAPQHKYLFLTKNPSKYESLWDATDNLWFGATATNKNSLNSALDSFMQQRVNAEKYLNTFLSIEPLIERIEINQLDGYFSCTDWVIIGAQTGPGAVQPQREWVDHIVGRCKESGIPVFMKNSLKELMGDDFIQEWPEGLR